MFILQNGNKNDVSSNVFNFFQPKSSMLLKSLHKQIFVKNIVENNAKLFL